MGLMDMINRWFGAPPPNTDPQAESDDYGGTAVLDEPTAPTSVEVEGDFPSATTDSNGIATDRPPLTAADHSIDRESHAEFSSAAGTPPGYESAVEAPVGWWAERSAKDERNGDWAASFEGIDSRLHHTLIAVLDNPNIELPPMPLVAQQVLSALVDDQSDMRKAADLTGQDPALAAAVLRLVNSTAYRGMREINRLDQAFVRIGRKGARAMLLSALVKDLTVKMGRAQRELAGSLWSCALASATIAENLAARYRISVEDAFLTGLLHDVGRLAILRIVCEFERKNNVVVRRGVFESVSDRWHEHIGLRVAEAWNLPSPLPEIIASHHSAPPLDDPLRIHKLMIQFTDLCCARLGHAAPIRGDFFAFPCVRGLELYDNLPSRKLLETIPELLDERLRLTSAGDE